MEAHPRCSALSQHCHGHAHGRSYHLGECQRCRGAVECTVVQASLPRTDESTLFKSFQSADRTTIASPYAAAKQTTVCRTQWSALASTKCRAHDRANWSSLGIANHKSSDERSDHPAQCSSIAQPIRANESCADFDGCTIPDSFVGSDVVAERSSQYGSKHFTVGGPVAGAYSTALASAIECTEQAAVRRAQHQSFSRTFIEPVASTLHSPQSSAFASTKCESFGATVDRTNHQSVSIPF